MAMKLFLIYALVGLVSAVYDLKQVNSWMVQLQDFGKDKLDKFNEGKDNKGRVSQYLVAGVVSEREFKDSSQMTKVVDSGRMKFYLNEYRPEVSKRKYHGEQIFLYDDEGGLDDMVKKLREKNKKAKPIVLMFSHFIPCANVAGLGYSCSEEIGKVAKLVNYPFIVGFTKIYSGTNEQLANAYMDRAYLYRQIDQKLQNNEILYLPYMIRNEKQTFQTIFSQCLLDTLQIEKCETEGQRKTLIIMFTNAAVYECTKDTQASGKLVEPARQTFVNCINDNFVKYGNTNSIESVSSKTYIKLCAISAVQTEPYFSKFSNLEYHTWDIYYGAWKDLSPKLSKNTIRIPRCPPQSSIVTFITNLLNTVMDHKDKKQITINKKNRGMYGLKRHRNRM